MNEEEKQAIEKLSGNKNETTWNDTIRQIKREEITDVVVTRQKYITILLNLIEKQQKEIKARLKEIESLYKMMSVKDDEIKYLEQKLEQYGLDYQILKDDIEGHKIVYIDTPEFEEKYISKDKIKEKIDLIDKEYAEIIEKNKNNLYLVNINAQRHNAMQTILEELLSENKGGL